MVELKRKLGFWQAYATATGLVVAGSTMVSLGNGFGSIGPAFIVAAFIAMIISIIIALSYAELSSIMPGPGMIGDYTLVSMGRFMSIVTLLAGYLVLAATVGPMETMTASMAIEYLIPGVNTMFIAVAILVAFLVVNVLGVQIFGSVQLGIVLLLMLSTAVMGSSVLVGSLIGSFDSELLTEIQVNIVYGILALLAAIMMFIPKKQNDESHIEQVKFNKPLAAILAFFVGIGSGVVGAGGGFLLIPIMLLILRIPTRMAIASSLAITFISAVAGTIGKISTGQVEYLPTIIIISAGLIAAPIGAKISTKLNTKVLENILAILILGTAVKIWIDIF